MALFEDMVAYQEEVRDPSRVAEVLTRVISQAKRLSGPAQLNIPRDFWTQVVDIEIPDPIDFERSSGGDPLLKPQSYCRTRKTRSFLTALAWFCRTVVLRRQRPC